MWQEWLNVLLGLWIVVLAFLNPSHGTMVWALVISGFAIAILAFWATMSDTRGGFLGGPPYHHNDSINET